MKKLFVSIIIASMAITIGLYAQETVQTEPKVDLKVVYEKIFDEPIVDIIFDMVTVSIEEATKMGWEEEALADRKDGKASIPLPKLAIVSNGDFYGHPALYVSETKRSCVEIKEIRFYDNKCKTRNILEIGKLGEEKIYVSPHNRYVLVNRRPAEYNYEYSGGVLYDLYGKKIWEIDINGPSPIAISDEGHAVAAYYPGSPPTPGGDFYVYNPKGQLISTIKNPDIRKFAPVFAKFSNDGEYAIMSFLIEALAPPTMFVFTTKEGEILWEKNFPEYRFSGYNEEMAVTSIGVIGITGLSPSLFYIDKKGDVKWTVPLEARGFMVVEITEDKKKVFVVSSKGYVWCIDTNEGKILWKHREPWSPKPTNKISPPDVPHFSELRMNENMLFIIGKKGIPWHSSTLFIFDAKIGKLLQTIEFPQEKITFAQIEKAVGLINITKGKISILKLEVLK